MSEVIEDKYFATPDVPKSWATPVFSDVFTSISTSGKKIKQRDYKSSGKIPVVDQGEAFIGGYTDNENLAIEVTDPIIVFGDHTRVFKFLRHDFAPGADGTKILVPSEALDRKYAFFACKAARFPDKGYSRHFSFLKKIKVPLAPLNEQERIVDKIETLFARLDKGEEAVRDVQKLLTRYRQSVLKSAVTGQLTADWRAKQSGQLEHGRDLLARILETRRKTWDGRGKYKEPPEVVSSTLSASPEGWVWSTSGQLCDCIVPNRDKPKSFTGDVPWINIPDLAGTGLYIDSSKEGIGLSNTEIELARARVIPESSVIMSCVGRFGIAAVCERDLVINQQLHAFLVPKGLLAPEFLALSLQAQQKFMEDTSTATTIAYLNKSKCNSVPIPLPSFEEQQEIVSQTMQAFENADIVEELCKTELKRSASLRQSILKDAFAGKLVPQDPTDEPASALLARIAAEKPIAKKTRRKTPP
jgi:type I restriction enzyme S subunit